jgi:transcriptional antiterminator
VIYLRHVCSQNVLAEMLGLCQRTIGPSVKEVRRLLQEHRIAITPTTLCFSSSQEIEDFVHTGAPATARLQRTHHLAAAALTGMDRAELGELIDRLAVRQAALIERRRHQQRGGPRQPGTRGGVFRQKITDAERLLAAVLYRRKLGTRQVLADAFGISLSTLNNALADAKPVLEDAGITLSLFRGESPG